MKVLLSAAALLAVASADMVPGAVFDRFVTIWLENTDYSKAAGDPSLQWLAKRGITLSNYFGVTHPSEGNYVAAFGGDHFGMQNDDLNKIASNVSSVADLLEDKSVSWGAYQEDMPSTGFAGFDYRNPKTRANMYVRKHNPPIIYDSVADVSSRTAKIKNTTLFHQDLEAGTLPQYIFITPNMTSDGHDSSVTVAGTWTRNFLEPLLNDDRFMQRTLVLVTFDENHSYAQQNRVFSILLGDAVPANKVGTTDAAYYNHYSELATVEANWGLHHLGRYDAGANVFSLVAGETGDEVRTWDAATGTVPTRFFNLSYQGPFNTANKAPYPAPNTELEVNGRTVLPVIKEAWGQRKNYYDGSVENADGLNPPRAK